MFEAYRYPRNYFTFWHIGARMGVAPVRRFLRRMQRAGKSTLLDIGSGAGSNALMAARLGYSVTALDRSRQSLREMRRVGAALNVSGSLHSLIGDACRLPLPDQSFDIVFASHIIEHLDEPRRLVDECARVLRPGGVLRLACPTTHHGMRLSRRLGINLDPHDHKVLGYSAADIVSMLPATLRATRTTYQGRVFESNLTDLQQVLAARLGIQANPVDAGEPENRVLQPAEVGAVLYTLKEMALVPALALCKVEDVVLPVKGSMLSMEITKE
jgi:SAM-dependent methyltransferase